MNKPVDIPDISVIIPALNEEESLPPLFMELERFMGTVDLKVQFVFVDDGSSDGTADYIAKHCIPKASMKLVRLSRNFGTHAAIRAGISQADADYCMLYSVDLPKSVAVIKRFYDELASGNDLVYSRRMGYRGGLGSRIYSKLVNRLIGLGFPEEGVSGLAFNQKIKAELNRNIEANSSLYFQIFSLGFKRKSFETPFEERASGESKWTFAGKVKLFFDSFIMFSYVPIRFISIMGILLAILGFLWAVFIVISKLLNPSYFEAGWPTLMSLLLIGFGVTNFSLGIIAEYLVRTLDAARNRPVFVIDEVDEMCGDKTAKGSRAAIGQPDAEGPAPSRQPASPA
ncbi:MAG: glycosyltransferase [Coriobacteriales bacterium]|jgi:dolichol-phosphate mannosyltransferase|nr:glycosyltransferase [Coriobacteriales bacterium]